MAATGPPPPSQVLALRMDQIVGKSLSGDLAQLFLALSKACALVAEDEHFSQIQKYATSFLFDEGKQSLRVILTAQGTTVEIEHGVNESNGSFPLIRKFADIDILFQFKSIKTVDEMDANQLRVGIGAVGFPPIEVVSNKLRRAISLVTDGGEAKRYPKPMTRAVIEALLQVLPNSHQFLSDLFNMETFEFELTPKGEGLFVDADVDVNIEKLEILYPAVANWVKHVQELEIVVLDFDSAKISGEGDLEKAKCMVRLRIYFQSGWVGAHVSFMLAASDPPTLLWFDQKTNQCVKNSNGEPWPIEFDEAQVGGETKFRIALRESIRPFINLSALREFLERDFHLEIEFVPSTIGKHDFFVRGNERGSDTSEKYEIIAGHWSMVLRLKMVIVPVAGVITSFFKMFASTQLASPDDLLFWWQMVSSWQRDMMLMHGRIARGEGAKPQFELSQDEQTVFRPKQPKRKAKSRGMRCTIS